MMYNQVHPILQSYLDAYKSSIVDLDLAKLNLMTYKKGIEEHLIYIESKSTDQHPIEKARIDLCEAINTHKNKVYVQYDLELELKALNGVRGFQKEYSIDDITKMHKDFMEKYSEAMSYKVD